MEISRLTGTLSADPLLLERAIMNVVSNALDYSPKDGCIDITITGEQ